MTPRERARPKAEPSGLPAFDVDPLTGAGPLRFGAARADVRAVLASLGHGAPASFRRGPHEVDHIAGARVQFGYDDRERLTYVEFATSIDAPVLLSGQDLTKAPAAELVPLLAAAGTLYEGAGGCDYTSFVLGLSLWRERRSGRRFTSVLVGSREYMRSYEPLLPRWKVWRPTPPRS